MKQIEKIKTTNWQGNAPHTMWCRLADKINELVDAFNSLASQGEKETWTMPVRFKDHSFQMKNGKLYMDDELVYDAFPPRPPFQGECNACKPHVCASSVGFGCLCIHSCQKEQPSPGWGLNKSDSQSDVNAQKESWDSLKSLIVELDVEGWERQGRSELEKHGVRNFLTGKGGINLRKKFILKSSLIKSIEALKVPPYGDSWSNGWKECKNEVLNLLKQ